MSSHSIVVMLYVELAMLLGGFGCLVVARMLTTSSGKEGAPGVGLPKNKPGFVLSRLGT